MKVTFSKLRLLLFAIFRKNCWSNLEASDVLVVRHDADCGYQHAGKAYSPIIDTVVEECFKKNISVQSVATPISRLVGARAYNSPAAFNRSLSWIALWVRMLSVFIGREKSKEYGVSRKAVVWLKILNLVKPKIVIGIQPDLALCRACRLLNVPVYDIQHGVISKDNKWYGDILPNKVAVSDLPDGFLCWDRQSAEYLKSWAPARGVTINVIGHPWFQRFQFPSDNDLLVQDALRSSRIFFDEKPIILVALQWGLHIHYYSDIDFNKVMCKALESVIKRTHNRYNWLLRLHPIQLTGDEGEYCEAYLDQEFGGFAGVEWHRASLLPLPILLSQASLHITDMSSVVIEASWFGLPSALLNPYLNKGGILEGLYDYERRSGIATVVEQNAEAIELWISERLSCAQAAPSVVPEGGIQAILDKAMMKA
ncbi:hypothetical protein PSH84_12970 [Pseudomonas beijingensis]|jgi:hypothetical protein|uniref:Capsule polysaccharide biosynthesis protein n=1 Tax=Pseudomonas beijingensis TaxID=2954101 RepID=A0ABY9FHK2_9PSED|nr:MULTISPECIES: hypothetical protein [unclassified Pseudomonas]WLH02857.1 hypothetical protein PSH92_08300 [Pseudomonas sp. FP2034]WLI47688.1 hypothetical protein PSH84_12970 [Pseudomonas sp. FP830]